MFEIILGSIATAVIITLALYDFDRDHNERYGRITEEHQHPEALLGVVYPEEQKDKKDA